MSGLSKAQAQISKGTALIGGRITYYHNTQEEKNTNPNTAAFVDKLKSDNSYLYFSPSAGFFIADNLALGLSFGVGKQHYNSPYLSYDSIPNLYTNTSEGTNFSLAPFLRYYYMPKENFGFYGQLTAGYSTQLNKYESNRPDNINSKSRETGFYIEFTPAFVFFPTSKLGLEASIGGINYSRTRTKSENPPVDRIDPESKRSSLYSNFGFNSLALGVSYYIGRQ
jgi:hypothetical protein